ncbi:MAG: cytochrome-c peroxidase [Planctomycetota bacterium]
MGTSGNLRKQSWMAFGVLGLMLVNGYTALGDSRGGSRGGAHRGANGTADILEELAGELRGAAAGGQTSHGDGHGDDDGHGDGHGDDDGRGSGTGFYPRDEPKEELGKLLFWDKILSGNMDISCATCHHSLAATGDGLSLPLGQGAAGLGVTRSAEGVTERVPRNAPHLFNLGAVEFTTMFHDGRVQADSSQPSGFLSPAGNDLPTTLDNVLAAQAMFPVTSGAEMAGAPGDNPIANAAHAGDLPLVWDLLAQRLQGIPEYVTMFQQAFPGIAPSEITYAYAANAIAAYEAAAFRADDSPYDRYLAGDKKALSKHEKDGKKLFFGAAGCADCHSGRFQTSHGFKAIAMPQIGPGKGDNLPGYLDGRDDFGRERVTGDANDRFRFRVLSLRNVALTGPWGHDGAYNTLEAVVRHHLDPVGSLESYDQDQCVLPPNPALPADFDVMNDAYRRSEIAAANELPASALSDDNVARLLDFLHALTDTRSLDLRDSVPLEVPSGLPVFD